MRAKNPPLYYILCEV